MSAPGFELHHKQAPRKTDKVSLLKSGYIRIPANTYEELGRPETIEYLFNREEQLLAIRPAQDTSNGYKVNQQSKTGQAQIYATSVCREYEIILSKSTRHKPRIENGMLIIDVSELTQEAT